MFKTIEGLPEYVLGVEARGKITDKDYKDLLIPRADRLFSKYPAIRMLYVAGKSFKGYDARAVWDDTVFGLNH